MTECPYDGIKFLYEEVELTGKDYYVAWGAPCRHIFANVKCFESDSEFDCLEFIKREVGKSGALVPGLDNIKVGQTVWYTFGKNAGGFVVQDFPKRERENAEVQESNTKFFLDRIAEESLSLDISKMRELYHAGLILPGHKIKFPDKTRHIMFAPLDAGDTTP